MNEKERSDKKILYLEASLDKTIIKLFSQSGGIISGFCQGSRNQSEELLREIDRLLKKSKIQRTAITNVAVNTGQNSYTSARIIATTANLLAFSLNIGIFSASSDDCNTIFESLSSGEEIAFQNYIVPVYKHEPVITRPKSRL